MRVAPMLATAAEPFDSPQHLFEIKWDGIRALAAVDAGGWRLWGRGAEPYTDRYPELDLLRRLPAGTVLDGELVRRRGGRAVFSEVLRRHQLRSPRKIRGAAVHEPVTYVVFDLLQLGGRCLLAEPLSQRRARLLELLAELRDGPLLPSAAVVGSGKSYFRRAVQAGHEGVMAKRLASRYQPGKRSPAWRKIKPRQEAVCLVVGYRTRRDGSPARLLLAAAPHGALEYVGQVLCGAGREMANRLLRRLAPLRCAAPCVPCPKRARWVRPELYCRVRCFGWTPGGRLRFPTLVGLLEDPAG